MSKKELPIESITNELAGGASLFFTSPKPKPSAKKIRKSPVVERVSTRKFVKKARDVKDEIDDAITPSRYRDSKHDSMIASYHDSTLEPIRKTLKTFGKEVSTHRLTPEEKKAMADIVYAYRGRGIRTSENEFARIAINFLVNDHRENGGNSLVEKVLRLLHE